jgi:hypothetical protein
MRTTDHCHILLLVGWALTVGCLGSAAARDGPGKEPGSKNTDRAQAVEWVRAKNAFGPDHRIVKDVKAFVDSLPNAAHGFKLKMSGDLVKTGRGVILLGWRRHFWAFELSPEATAKLEKSALQTTVMKPLADLGEVRPDFAIAPPVFDAGSSLPLDQAITGKLPFKNLDRESRGYPSIRLTTWTGTTVTIQYSHYLSKFVGKKDKEFKFRFDTPKASSLGPGPVVLVIDVVEFADDVRTGPPFVVSNPVAVLVNVSKR